MAGSLPSKQTEALRLVTELEALLCAYGERNWIRGVRGLKNTLTHPGALKEAAASYRNMLAGNGSFSDFYIHADDVEERRRLNEPLDQLRDHLWRALEA